MKEVIKYSKRLFIGWIVVSLISAGAVVVSGYSLKVVYDDLQAEQEAEENEVYTFGDVYAEVPDLSQK